MKNGKSPGQDGFTVEWTVICHFTLRSLKYGYRTGSLSITNKKSAGSGVAPAGIKSHKFIFELTKICFAVFKRLMG